MSAAGTTPTVRLSGAEALVKLLLAEGVQEAFGIVGGKLAPLLHALSRSPIAFVGVRHEAAGPMMAAAIRASTGRVAVALGEMGPGALNLAAGAGVAFNNHIPALFITTNQHRAASYPARGMFMDLDTRALFAPLTKWNVVVADSRRLPELVRHAFREALSGRPGPVHLDIPQDVLAERHDWPAQTFEVPPHRYRAVHGPRPASESITQAAALLRDARRPLLVAGGGVIASGAEEGIRRLASRLAAPVVPTQMALGVVASDGESFIGHGGLIAGDAVLQAFDEADAIVAIGCRFSSWMWDEHGPFARDHHALVNINTDPGALGSPALHQVAIQADARLAVDDLLDALGSTAPAAEADWLHRLRRTRQEHESGLATMAGEAPGSEPMHPAALAQAIGHVLPRDALVVFDGGHTSFWSNDLTPVQAPRTRFHDPGMSQLGFGLPWALALQIAHPGRCVVNITGDGSFGFTLPELDTARREKLPVLNIVHNNAAWGIIQAGQRAGLDFEFGTSLAGTDYAAVARGFGTFGEVVTRVEDVAASIGRALASGLPAVLDCRTRFVRHPATAAFGRMNRFGFDQA